ncbi:hypothetical protein Bcep22_gp01 [Burkholderia phage Bcep22]|uniref:Uncharacterized protein n=1 Tax=Burkholderia phage Bcep22 TaxID=2883944 RepID=Q6V7U1_9CAUD|nr:hypothetical protein Bcep22_gp01 [Burkholderia phage Bcep22]AAQ54937.1 hypothetical protein Bcep22_gp01 [Burkholderia phage Bcep22]
MNESTEPSMSKTLTMERRASLEWAIETAITCGYTSDADVLRGLLADILATQQPEPVTVASLLEWAGVPDACRKEPEPRDEVTDERPSLTNPLTPYGMLVRALRIVTGTLLYDMAKSMSLSPATLSAMEVGRRPVTCAEACGAADFFASRGLPGTLQALEHAIDAARAGGEQ